MTVPCAVPVIETEDLILRGYRESDFQPFAEFASSERASFVGGPQNRHDSWRSFMASIGHWALRGYGMWVVEHRESGQVAGRVGVIYNDGWHEPEMGWHIYDGFEGKGYAYQASLAARNHAARHFGLDGIISYIDAANTRSLNLARRLECRYERDAELMGKPCQIWRHPKIQESAA